MNDRKALQLLRELFPHTMYALLPKPLHFQIEYTNLVGDSVETLASTDNPELLRELFEEFLAAAQHDSAAMFQVGGVCACNDRVVV